MPVTPSYTVRLRNHAHDLDANAHLPAEVLSAVSTDTTKVLAPDGAGGVHFISPSGGSSSALPWYNVKTDGTCVGDGVTDDTAALQAAITAATASGTKSATLYFPPGTYKIAGALQDTGAFNGQILLPSVSTGSSQITIAFVGASRPPFEYIGPLPNPGGNSIIKSTLTGASGTAACISGGNGSGYGAYNNITTVWENLIFAAPDNPTFTMVNIRQTQGGAFHGVQISTTGAFGGSPVQPTHTNSYGVKLPQIYDSNYTEIDGLSVGSFYTQVLDGELTIMRGLILSNGVVGIEEPAAFYPSVIYHMTWTCLEYVLRFTGAKTLDVHAIVGEKVTVALGAAAWQVTVYDLDDASNYGSGHIRWWNITANDPTPGAGANHHDYLINSATGMFTEEMSKLAPNSGVTAATYGDATHVAQVAVDAYGRITSASAVAITAASTLDDLTDVTITTPAAGQKLRYNGSLWVNVRTWHEPQFDYAGSAILDGAGNPIMVEVVS